MRALDDLLREFVLDGQVIETNPIWIRFKLGLREREKALLNMIEMRDLIIDHNKRYLNTPEYEDFAAGVVSEARHQLTIREEDDERKEPQDWFWTLGYLAGKALRAAVAGDYTKTKHHIITTAALLNNWHRAILAREKEEKG